MICWVRPSAAGQARQDSDGNIPSGYAHLQGKTLKFRVKFCQAIMFTGTALCYYVSVGFNIYLVNKQNLTIAFHRI